MSQVLSYVVLFVVAALLPLGCTPPGGGGGGGAPQALSIYNWSTYIDPQVLKDFEQKFNAKITYDTFDSPDTLYAKLKAGNPGYDIVVPPDYLVERMGKEGLLEPLDQTKLPNMANLDPVFLDPPYDPGNKYSVPYQWGTQGIGYNQEKTGGPIDSMAAMFDPKYKGKVAWLDEMRATMGAVLLYLGYSPNTEDAKEITAAKDFMIKHKDTIGAFAGDDGQNLLIQGDMDLVYEYSGDIFQAGTEDPNLKYVIPKEGAILWTDNLVIPKGAPHKATAEAFINYVLEPKVGAQISNFIHYGSPNLAAREQGLITKEDLENPGIYPPPETFAKLQFIQEVPPEVRKLYDQAWTAIKVAVGKG
ncbi:MAG: spermidine/putrescine ABC transporter substrate-binding protein [Gloeomargaritaceae cyanobacterium C42_A2020_066]|nr:spermidine/putrescine ABC transporter substrate-binding protein [Gloeomargaritaceae cyanobacterium C42_A2020_066]